MPDREKVIKGLEELSGFLFKEYGKAHAEEASLYYDRFLAVDGALDLLKEQEWNLLTEDDDGIVHGLPGDDGQYLMTDGKDIWIDDYVDGVDDGVWLDSGRDIREIKAWMYMPELPK